MPADFIWVELECRETENHVRMFRGRGGRSDIDAIIAGNAPPFIKLEECYWYNDPQESTEEWEEPFGTFERLGHGIFTNYTGEMFIRCDTILNISILKGGYDDEPRGS